MDGCENIAENGVFSHSEQMLNLPKRFQKSSIPEATGVSME